MIQRPIKTEINEDINEELNDISKRRSLNLPNFSITNLYKKKNKKKEPLVIKYIIILIKIQSQDVFKPLNPWIPNYLTGKTLNKFEILKDKHCITDLEKVI